MPLTREEIQTCRDAFDRFDKDGSGSVDLMELKASLNGLGAQPSEEELHMMIQQVDEDGSNEIHFAEFLKIIEAHKARQSGTDQDDADTLEAFVALGGKADKSGGVLLEKISSLIGVRNNPYSCANKRAYCLGSCCEIRGLKGAHALWAWSCVVSEVYGRGFIRCV